MPLMRFESGITITILPVEAGSPITRPSVNQNLIIIIKGRHPRKEVTVSERLIAMSQQKRDIERRSNRRIPQSPQYLSSTSIHHPTAKTTIRWKHLVLVVSQILCSSRQCHAFQLPPPLGRTVSSQSSFTICKSTIATATTTTSVVVEDTDDLIASDDPKAGWIGWLVTGKPRGTSKVLMREAVELGGVPRSERYSSKDWFHNTVTLPSSGVLQDIRSPVICLTSWAVIWSIVHRRLLHTNPAAAARLYIPSAPHSLMMSALGLLLVFRTNSAYQRFNEGRLIWENIVNSSRDIFRMLLLYEDEIGLEKRRRMQRLLAAFPYLLRHRIRPNLVMKRVDDEQYQRDPSNTILLYQDTGPKDMDYEAAAVAQTEETTGKSRRKTRPLYWVDKRSLPWRLLPSLALEKCARAQNRPLWVCDRMSKEIRTVPDQPGFQNRERLIIIDHINKLSRCIGGAERIHQTVVPLNYARHTLRALTLWLLTLPFALVKDLQLGTGPVLFLVAWLLFGVYEIGVRIEDPFQGTLRLSIMCDMVRRDVLGDETIRASAFELEIEGEPVNGEDADDEEESEEDKDFEMD